MKKVSIPKLVILTAFVSFLMTSCGNSESDSLNAIISSNDIKKARDLKSELSAKQSELNKQIAILDSLIGASVGDRNLPLVTTFSAESKQFNHYIELQGGVTTKQNVLIYPEMAGTLTKVSVTEGQRVSKGQVLGIIDNGGLSRQLSQMKTQLTLAKTTFERTSNLWKQEIGTELQYLQAKASYEAQEDAVKQMEIQLGKFSIRAPFSGVIDDVIKDQGTVVAPGGPGSEVFRIINLSNMFIEVAVPETYISSVSKGRKVEVIFPVLGKTVQSFVRQTGNFINPNNRSFTVEIPVPNTDGNIKPNLTAKVLINDYISENAILIPQSVISENAEGEQYAYVTSKISKDQTATASRNIVTTGKTQGDYVEILSGISVGENIINEGARSVKEGQKVKILTQ